VLENILNEYSFNNSDIKEIRINATYKVAQKSNITQNTIFDKITRQLNPFINSIDEFDKYLLSWLKKDSRELKRIIILRCIDEEDIIRVNDFFTLADIETLLIDDINSGITQSYKEGKKKLYIHFVKERNRTLIIDAKKYWSGLKKNKEGITCEVCSFNFSKMYGRFGDGYIEAHHMSPISELNADTETKIQDLIPLCANCHRMIHKQQPWLSVDELKKMVISNSTRLTTL
jgi:predicted HNH restriction endonuclease